VYSSSDYAEIGIGDASEGPLQRSIVAPAVAPFGDIMRMAIAAHPTNPDIVFAGNAGLRYSSDGGLSWHDGPAMFASTSVSAIAFDPSDPRIVWVYASSISTTDRIYRSVDGGDTFAPVGTGPASVQPTHLLVDPKNSSHLFLTSWFSPGNNGVFRSEDAGVTWTRVLNTGNTGVDIAIDPFNSNRVYAVATGGLYISDNNGVTFHSSGDFQISPSAVAVDPTVPGVVYVLVPVGYGDVRIMRSVDAAQSWERVPSSSDPGWTVTDLAINAAAPTVVLWLVTRRTVVRDCDRCSGDDSGTLRHSHE
jgi:photosystem II stability/assembly factor-like uncharacterized protein